MHKKVPPTPNKTKMRLQETQINNNPREINLKIRKRQMNNNPRQINFKIRKRHNHTELTKHLTQKKEQDYKQDTTLPMEKLTSLSQLTHSTGRSNNIGWICA